jgi:hypothetical protein
MSRIIRVLLCVICSFGTLSFAQSGCGAIASSGSVSSGKYYNKQLGLTYQIPDGLTASELRALPQDPTGRGAVLVALWKVPREYDKPSVFVQTDDPFQYRDQSALGYMHRIQNTVSGPQHGKVLQSGKTYSLSGITFYRLDYHFSDSVPPIFNIALTGRVGKCELTFQVSAKTQAEIEKLFQSLTKVSIAPN